MGDEVGEVGEGWGYVGEGWGYVGVRGVFSL